MVTYTDPSKGADDNSGKAVRGQIFDPRVAGTDIEGAGTADGFVGSKFDDKIKGSDGNDKLYGGGGNDKLKGQNDNDKLFGDKGTMTSFMAASVMIN